MVTIEEINAALTKKTDELNYLISISGNYATADRPSYERDVEAAKQEVLLLQNTFSNLLAGQQTKTQTDTVRQESRLDTTPTIVQQGQTTQNQSWLPLALIGLGFLVLAN